MKFILFILMQGMVVASSAQETQSLRHVEPILKKDADPFFKRSSYPGGDVLREQFIETHLKIPAEVSNQRIMGTVLVFFSVAKDGMLADIEIAKPIEGCEKCSEASIEVVQSMPRWIPAHTFRDGKKINFRTSELIEVHFK